MRCASAKKNLRSISIQSSSIEALRRDPSKASVEEERVNITIKETTTITVETIITTREEEDIMVVENIMTIEAKETPEMEEDS